MDELVEKIIARVEARAESFVQPDIDDEKRDATAWFNDTEGSVKLPALQNRCIPLPSRKMIQLGLDPAAFPPESNSVNFWSTLLNLFGLEPDAMCQALFAEEICEIETVPGDLGTKEDLEAVCKANRLSHMNQKECQQMREWDAEKKRIAAYRWFLPLTFTPEAFLVELNAQILLPLSIYEKFDGLFWEPLACGVSKALELHIKSRVVSLAIAVVQDWLMDLVLPWRVHIKNGNKATVLDCYLNCIVGPSVEAKRMVHEIVTLKRFKNLKCGSNYMYLLSQAVDLKDDVHPFIRACQKHERAVVLLFLSGLEITTGSIVRDYPVTKTRLYYRQGTYFLKGKRSTDVLELLSYAYDNLHG